MDAILVNVSDNELVADKFNDAVATMTQDDRYFALHERSVARTATSLKPAAVVKRLQSLLEEGLPQYIATFNDAVKQNGRPSRLIRYWLPATTLLVR
jgi:nuclear-control-of-ATPase protein 2